MNSYASRKEEQVWCSELISASAHAFVVYNLLGKNTLADICIHNSLWICGKTPRSGLKISELRICQLLYFSSTKIIRFTV